MTAHIDEPIASPPGKVNPYTGIRQSPVVAMSSSSDNGTDVKTAKTVTQKESNMGTRTYVILPVNPGTYAEIKEKMQANGYDHAIHTRDGDTPECVDMHGIAIAPVDVGPNPATLLREYVASQRLLTAEDEAFFTKMEAYCNEIVSAGITKGEQAEG